MRNYKINSKTIQTKRKYSQRKKENFCQQKNQEKYIQDKRRW